MEVLEGASSGERFLMGKAASANVPINGSMELLPLCNMNCDMCYVRLSRTEMERQGRLRCAEEWLELGKQMKESGVLFLLLTGGEPLLFPDFKWLYLELKKLGFILTINTNGTLIDEEWAAFFGMHKPRRINITLYGADEETYTKLCHYPGGFSKVLRGVQLLKAQGVDVKLAGSITKANVDEMDRLAEIGNELDVPMHMDTYMMAATRERELPFNVQSRMDPVTAGRATIKALKYSMTPNFFCQYIKQTLERVSENRGDAIPKGMTCYAGRCSFTINWQGQMRPCVVMTEPAVNVFEEGFAAAWKQINEACSCILLNGKCSACRLRCLCRICAAGALLETGDYMGVPEYLCKFAKASFEAVQEEAKELGL